MKENTKLKYIYKEAYKILEKKVGKDILKKHLDYYHNRSPKSIPDVFKQMIQCLKNKQGYTNFIANVDHMNSMLENYNPRKILTKYENRWEQLFK